MYIKIHTSNQDDDPEKVIYSAVDRLWQDDAHQTVL